MQPEYNIEEFVENNVEIFNICVTALARFFASKILVFDILKNEESVIQDRELRNQNSPISFTIENQVLLCFVYKKKIFFEWKWFTWFNQRSRISLQYWATTTDNASFRALKSLFESS